jgi:hypothetical protein
MPRPALYDDNNDNDDENRNVDILGIQQPIGSFNGWNIQAMVRAVAKGWLETSAKESHWNRDELVRQFAREFAYRAGKIDCRDGVCRNANCRRCNDNRQRKLGPLVQHKTDERCGHRTADRVETDAIKVCELCDARDCEPCDYFHCGVDGCQCRGCPDCDKFHPTKHLIFDNWREPYDNPYCGIDYPERRANIYSPTSPPPVTLQRTVTDDYDGPVTPYGYDPTADPHDYAPTSPSNYY